MNLKALIFKEEDAIDKTIQELKRENESLWDMVRKHYCAEHDRWFEKVSAKNMHDRWHEGKNPFQNSK